jgi:3-keto-5-aminohexanoate cleavage enzyme
MNTPCIITVAITGSVPGKKDNPAVPISVAEQVESTHEAFEAGATLVHLHVRNDDGSPSSSAERFAKVLEGIRRHCPNIITQVSTAGARARARSAAELGGHCRTGLEDNGRMDRETLAPSNAALVRQTVDLCAQHGRRPATAAEARRILGL